MKSCLLALLAALALPLGAAEPTIPLPEPGPEAGGLRLRLLVSPRSGNEGYEVRVDLLNASDRTITVRANWRNDEAGDLREYIDAGTSIE